MTSIVENLWNAIYQYGVSVRSNKLNGLTEWNKIKTILKKYNGNGEWSLEAISRYNEMKKLFNIVDEENNKEWPEEDIEKWENTHFFFQHAKIPYDNVNEPNLTRLMQIAYNAGQLEADKDSKYYTVERKTYYIKNNLNSYISFMTPHSLIELERELSKYHPALKEINDIKFKGGKKENFKHKFFKYCKKNK
jgi:hypothetical protein